MRSLILSLLILVVASLNLSGQGKFDWAKQLATVGAGTVDITDMKTDGNNNVIVFGTYASGVSLNLAGSTTLASYGSTDVFLAKFTSSGSLVWARRIGGTGIDEAAYFRVDNAGNIYAVGIFRSATLNIGSKTLTNSGSGTREPYAVKYTSNGNVAWAKRFFWGTDQDQLNDITLSLDGRYITMIGTFRSNPFNYDNGGGGGTLTKIGTKDQFIARYDTSGAFQVIKQYSNNQTVTALKQVHPCLYGGYYVTGDIIGNLLQGGVVKLTARDNVAMDAMVFRVDNNLDFMWGRSGGYAGTGFDHVNSSTVDIYGNVYITGKTEAATLTFDSTATLPSKSWPAKGGGDFYVAKYSSAGNLQWLRRKGTAAYDNAYGLAIFQQMVQFAGIYGGPVTINHDVLNCEALGDTATGFAIFDRWGNEVGGKCISGNNQDEGHALTFDNNGETYVAGWSRSNPLNVGTIPLTNPNPGSYFGFLFNFEYPFSVVKTQKNVSCNGGNDGEITVTPYFYVNPITYTWSHDSNLHDSIATGLMAGNYTVTVKDSRDSTEVINVAITQPAVISVSSVITNVKCYGGNDGAINITVSGGTSPYTHKWTGNGVNVSAEDQVNLTFGNFVDTITDKNGCIKISSFTVTQPPQITFTGTTKVDILSPPGCNGSINLKVNGGTPPFGYSWTGPLGYTASTEDISGLCNPGDYKVTVTDANLCTADTTITIIDNLSFIAFICDKINVSCNGGNNGYAKVCTANSVGALSYEWKTVPGGVIVSTTNELTNAPAGTYSVTVTDAGSPPGSPSTTTVVLTQPATLPGITPNVTNVTCYGGNNGKIDLTTVSGGTSPYTYAWTGPSGFTSTSRNIANLKPGNYSVTVTDAKGCQAIQNNIPVTEPPVITSNLVSTTDVLCSGEQTGRLCVTVAGGAGTLNVLWNDPAAQATLCAEYLFAGNYSVTVYDQNNCTKTFGPYPVDEPLPISVVPVITPPLCNGGTDGSIVIAVSGGTPPFDYEWYHCSGGLVSTNKNLTNVGAGCYTLLVTDASNCTFTDDYTITEPAAITFSVNKTDVTGCYSDLTGVIQVAGVAGGTSPYNYSINNGSTYQSSTDFTGLAAGSYIVKVKDSHNCEQLYSSNPVVISQPTKVHLSDSSKTDVLGCYGDATGIITIVGAGGTPPYEFSLDCITWVNNGGNFTGLQAGTYSLGVKDSHGCIYCNSGIFTITQPPDITVNAPTSTNPLCNGSCDGTITITAGGGTGTLEYSIDDGATYQSSGDFTNLCAGIYTIKVRDANLCEKIPSPNIITLVDPPLLTCDISDYTDPTCYGFSDGTITVTSTGGTGLYAFTLTPGNVQNNTGLFTGLAAGNYTVSVTDINNCGPFSDSQTLSDPPDVVITSVDIIHVLCYGASTGSICINATGRAPLEYSFDNGTNWSVSNCMNDLPAGDYHIWVRDPQGCIEDGGTIPITESSELTFTAASTNISCSGICDGTITVTATGGTGTLEYSKDCGSAWQPSNIFNGLCAGTYSIAVRDANLCTTACQDVVLTEPDVLDISGVTIMPISCGGVVDGLIHVNASGGTEPYSFTLTPGNTQNTNGEFDGLAPGTYSVSLDDANGCGPVDSTNLVINGPEELIFYDAITPNDDKVNDEWNIHVINCYPHAIIRIFSPWGTRVFESEPGYPTPWDGKSNGRKLPAGTYYYVIDLNGDGSKIMKGTVNIIK